MVEVSGPEEMQIASKHEVQQKNIQFVYMCQPKFGQSKEFFNWIPATSLRE